MKVLLVGMDRKLFEDSSPVLERHVEYSSKIKELHIIVFSLKKHNLSFKKVNNLYIYPSNSLSRVHFLIDAYLLGSKIIKENNFVEENGVISAQDPMSIVGYALARKFKLPFQLQIHTDLFNPYFKNSLTTWSNFWYSGWVNLPLTKFLIRRADGIRVVSTSLAETLKTRFSNLKARVDVLPIFVDIEKIKNKVGHSDLNLKQKFSQFKFIILMASRLTKEKRIDVAFLVFKKVLEQFPHVGLLIAGEGKEKDNLEKLIKEMRIRDNVIFLGWQEDLSSLYKFSDLFLLTSEYEGFGLTLVEAGLSGVPIVTTEVGIAKTKTFEDGVNSFVCEVGDVACLARGVSKLLSDVELRDLFKSRMQDSIKSVTLAKDEYIQKYIGLMEGLVKND